jgi:hypothetical protein
MWPFTGGCHYSLDCKGYETGCGKCPQLASQQRADLSRVVAWCKTRTLPKHLTVVGISRWLSEYAGRSLILGSRPIRTIGNCVNCDEFFKVDKRFAQHALGISTNKKVILFGATNIDDFYKGFTYFLDAMKQLRSEDYLILIFGKSSSRSLAGFSQPTYSLLRQLWKPLGKR